MAWCLHLYLGLKAAFEFKFEVVLEHCDPLDQPPGHPFIVIRHRLLMLVQKSFELFKPLFAPRPEDRFIRPLQMASVRI